MCLHLERCYLVANAAALAMKEREVAQALRGHVWRACLAVQPPVRVELERVGAPDLGVALKDEHRELQVAACGDEQGFKTVAPWEIVVFDGDSEVELCISEKIQIRVEKRVSTAIDDHVDVKE